MKFFEECEAFAHSWFDVAASLFRRYPNPYSKHVLTEDVLESYIEDGKLHTRKLLTKTNPLPKWGEKFYKGPRFITIIEESIVDRESSAVVTYTRNITGNSLLGCTEKCEYKISNTNPHQTAIQKQAWLDSNIGFGLRRPILEFAVARYAKNQHKATIGLEHVIMNTEPLNLRSIVEQSRAKLSEKAKHSKELLCQKAKIAAESSAKLSEKAKHSKEVLSQKAKLASDLAKSKADLGKVKVHASEQE